MPAELGVRADVEKLMELENQALKTAGELVESAREAVDDLEKSRAPTDGDASDERVSETLRNKTDMPTPWKQNGCYGEFRAKASKKLTK